MNDAERTATMTLTAEDYVTANKLFVLEYYRQPRMLLGLAILLIIYLALLIVPNSLIGPTIPTFAYLLPFLLLLIPLATYFILAPRTARSTYPLQKTLHQPITFQWSQDGLRTVSDSGNWIVRWSDYLKWCENDAVFLFYQGPRLFQMIPKRALTPQQVRDLQNCLAENFPSKQGASK